MTASSRGEPPSLARKIALLSDPGLYPDRPDGVERIQTHMSCLFLTRNRVYKLKKPVRYDFLDFSTLEARRQDCEAEVRLNRRLAGPVYRGVTALTLDDAGRAALDGTGEVVEWLVRMRRLPADRMLDALIARGAVRDRDIAAIIRALVPFFRANRTAEPGGADYRAWLARTVRDDCRALAEPPHGLPPDTVEPLRAAQLDLLETRPELFDERVAQGWIVEGHGDLRPEHICLEDSVPVIFDCLEFNRRLRIVDALDELAYLALECERLGAPDVATRLLEDYSALSGDRPPARLLGFYKTSRACLRAKLALWHLHDADPASHDHWRDRARDYLRLAMKYRPV